MRILSCETVDFKRGEQAKNNEWIFGYQLRQLIVFGYCLLRRNIETTDNTKQLTAAQQLLKRATRDTDFGEIARPQGNVDVDVADDDVFEGDAQVLQRHQARFALGEHHVSWCCTPSQVWACRVKSLRTSRCLCIPKML